MAIDEENVITFEEIVAAVPASAMKDEGGVIDIMDVVWWMTGLSPSLYYVEKLPNVDKWAIRRAVARRA